MCRAARSWLVVLLAVLAGAMWCARSSEAQKSRHLERSERYFARAQDRGAIIEYRNVLSVDAANVQGVRQGEVHTGAHPSPEGSRARGVGDVRRRAKVYRVVA